MSLTLLICSYTCFKVTFPFSTVHCFSVTLNTQKPSRFDVLLARGCCPTPHLSLWLCLLVFLWKWDRSVKAEISRVNGPSEGCSDANGGLLFLTAPQRSARGRVTGQTELFFICPSVCLSFCH